MFFKWYDAANIDLFCFVFKDIVPVHILDHTRSPTSHFRNTSYWHKIRSNPYQWCCSVLQEDHVYLALWVNNKRKNWKWFLYISKQFRLFSTPNLTLSLISYIKSFFKWSQSYYFLQKVFILYLSLPIFSFLS